MAGAKRAIARNRETHYLKWFERLGPKALFFSFLPAVGDPLCAVAGWLRLPFWASVAWMAIGKFTRYVVMTAALLWLFPLLWALYNSFRSYSYTQTNGYLSFTATWFNQAGALVHVYTDGTVALNHGVVGFAEGDRDRVAVVGLRLVAPGLGSGCLRGRGGEWRARDGSKAMDGERVQDAAVDDEDEAPCDRDGGARCRQVGIAGRPAHEGLRNRLRRELGRSGHPRPPGARLHRVTR